MCNNNRLSYYISRNYINFVKSISNKRIITAIVFFLNNNNPCSIFIFQALYVMNI